jgi:DNA polymerase
MQNLPRKSPLKKAILAPQGYALVDCDSSQIEARTLAWLSGQDDLVGAFDKGEDVYKIMASAIYNKPIDSITDHERFVGKTTILGAGYGMGAAKFQAQLKTFNVEMTLAECERIISVYRETYPAIPDLWKEAQKAVRALAEGGEYTLGVGGLLKAKDNNILLPNKLAIKYPRLRKHEDEDTGRVEYVYDTKKGRATIPNRIYGGKATENICQALARIIIGDQMLMISKRYRVAMTVHDSVVALVPEAQAAEGRKYIEDCMRIRPKWATALPLNCESKMGKTYGG